MTLTENRLSLLGNPLLSSDEQALRWSRQAAEFIFDGQYERAREVLEEYWQGVGVRPVMNELSLLSEAEVLLQCGALTGHLGSSQRISGAQEAAKDILSESLRLFEIVGLAERVSEAKYELSICYWRLGALDEARIVLTEALQGLSDADLELKAKILIRQTLVEYSAHRYYEAWDRLKEAEPVFTSASDALKGRWHNQRALVLTKLGPAKRQSDYADRAIIEFTAAIHHYELAGHERFCGASLNNLAILLYQLGRYADAHEHLDRARTIYARFNDTGVVAQVDETRARVLVAEGRFSQAKKVVAGAVSALREGGEQALLADALVVQGVVQARLGKHEDSVETLREAIVTAEVAGAPESAGHAALTLVEEHGRERLSEDEAYAAYRRADELLARTQDAEDLARLRACARVVMERFGDVELPKGFSLPRAVLTYEARFIERALAEEDGSVSRAARRLGVKHQSLAHMLRARHRQLLAARTPAVPRRRSIIRIREPRRGARYESPERVRPVTVLHIDDHTVMAEATKSMLEAQGWRVEAYRDGLSGLSRLEGEDHYDLLVIDSDLPDVDGIAIVRRTRQIPHREGLPIIMLSSGNRRADAHRVGVDEFLQKPEGMILLIKTAARLLEGKR